MIKSGLTTVEPSQKGTLNKFNVPFCVYQAMFWRRATFPELDDSSIIAAGRLNFCVRDGNRCDPSAKATRTLPNTLSF